MQNLQSLGVAAKSVQLTLADKDGKPATRVTLFDQGVVQILQAAVTGLPPRQPFVLALSDNSNGSGHLEPLAGFMTNPAGAAIVNAVGPIRQVTQGDDAARRRYLVIAAGTPTDRANWCRHRPTPDRSMSARFGSEAAIEARLDQVRFTPKSGHCRAIVGCPLCAKSRHSSPHSIATLSGQGEQNRNGQPMRFDCTITGISASLASIRHRRRIGTHS